MFKILKGLVDTIKGGGRHKRFCHFCLAMLTEGIEIKGDVYCDMFCRVDELKKYKKLLPANVLESIDLAQEYRESGIL